MRFQIAQALAHFLWQGTAIAAVLFAVLQVLRDARSRYNACTGALLLMCASPVATFFYLAPAVSPVSGTHGMILDTALPSQEVVTTSWFETNATLLFSIWLAGALLLMVRATSAWWRARGVVTAGVEPLAGGLAASARRLAVQLGAESVRFRVSSRVASSLVFGWLKPIVVLPAAALGRLTEAEVEALLAHELAHVIRRDFLVNLLQTVAECVLFYHPLVWWVSARMRDERELCCDDIAVAVCRDEVLYSKALLRLEELRMEPALAATGGRLAHRIQRLLVGVEAERTNVAPGLALVLLLGVSVALLAQTAPPAPPAPPAPASAPDAPPAPQAPPVRTTGSETAYRIGDGVSAPVPTYKVEPEYTTEAHAAHVEGTTLLSMVVSPEGTATDVKIVKSLDKGLDENAVEAVRQWKFKPGLKAGKPVPVIAKVEINFRLLEKPPEPPAAPAPPAVPSNAGTVQGTTGESTSANRSEIERRRQYATATLGGENTDRGKAYLRYGPPDEIESHPSTDVENWRYNDASKKTPVLDLSFHNGKQVGISKHTSTTGAATGASLPEKTSVKTAELKRRQDYAKQHFGGEYTDRGKAYVRYGPPDQIESHPGMGKENWRYLDAAKKSPTLDLEFRDEKQVGISKHTSTAGASAGASLPEKTSVNTAELARRQEYAKQHFGGENTDRGKVYVRYGPPDEIDSQASQGKRVDIWRYKDNSTAKVMLEIEFQDGKQVKRTGGLTTGQ
jgi:TonB family protein